MDKSISLIFSYDFWNILRAQCITICKSETDMQANVIKSHQCEFWSKDPKI